MPAPFEVLIGPLEVYIAAVGTAFPAVTASVPAGTWVKMGINDMEEAGIVVTHKQTVNEWRGVGGTGPRKVGRTQESLDIEFTLVDLTLEKYMLALGQTIINVPGPPGTKDIPLYMGTAVATYALLARGISPYADGYLAQYQVPVVYQSDSPAPAFAKGKPAGLKLKFTALEDPNAVTVSERFGELITQYQ